MGNLDTKRLKNAYLAMPVAALEVEKGVLFGSILKNQDIEASQIDTQYIAISLIDFLAEKLAIGQGASHEEIIGRTSEHVKRMCPSAGDDLCDAIASRVLDRLANGPDGYKAFSYAFFDSNTGKTRKYSFRLIEYWQPNLGEEHVFRATPEAVTLFLSMFTIDPIIEHAAQNFLIKHLLETGQISGAVEVSRRASSISIATQAELHSRILDLKRNPRRRGWVDDIIKRLQIAREHILSRYEEEGGLLETISEMMETEKEPTQQLADLIKLKSMVEKCYESHLKLGTHIAEAIQAFHRYHAHAFITPNHAIGFSPEEQIIPKVMDMPLGDALQMADDIGCHFLCPKEPKVLDLLALFNMFEDAREREMNASSKKTPDMVEVAAGVLDDFDKEREGRLRDRISLYVHTEKASSASEILTHMDTGGQQYVEDDYRAAINVLRSVFRRETDLSMEVAAKGHLKHRFVVGMDLAVTPIHKKDKSE